LKESGFEENLLKEIYWRNMDLKEIVSAKCVLWESG